MPFQFTHSVFFVCFGNTFLLIHLSRSSALILILFLLVLSLRFRPMNQFIFYRVRRQKKLKRAKETIFHICSLSLCLCVSVSPPSLSYSTACHFVMIMSSLSVYVILYVFAEYCQTFVHVHTKMSAFIRRRFFSRAFFLHLYCHCLRQLACLLEAVIKWNWTNYRYGVRKSFFFRQFWTYWQRLAYSKNINAYKRRGRYCRNLLQYSYRFSVYRACEHSKFENANIQKCTLFVSLRTMNQDEQPGYKHERPQGSLRTDANR